MIEFGGSLLDYGTQSGDNFFGELFSTQNLSGISVYFLRMPIDPTRYRLSNRDFMRTRSILQFLNVTQRVRVDYRRRILIAFAVIIGMVGGSSAHAQLPESVSPETRVSLVTACSRFPNWRRKPKHAAFLSCFFRNMPKI